jgi:hypothetical protein
MRIGLTFVVLLLVTGTAQAGAKGSDAEKRAQTIAPLLDGQSFVVARFDLSRADADELIVMLASVSQPLVAGVLGDAKELKQMLGQLRKLGGKELYAIYSFADTQKQPVFAVPLVGAADAMGMIDLLKGLPIPIHAEKIGAALVFGMEEACLRYRALKPTPRPELVKAFAAAGNTTAQFLVVATPEVRRAFEEIIPTLPQEIGGGSSKVLTRGVQWVAIGADGPPKMALQAVLQATDEPAAKALETWLTGALKSLGQIGEIKKMWPNFDTIAAALQPRREGDRLLMKLDDAQMTALIKPLVAKGQFAGAMTKVQESLRNLAFAMHAFHDNNKVFPTPASYDKQGKALLSWRVQLLPYLNQEALYKEFKLDEPWDSAHNIKLIAKMPAIYRHPKGLGVKEGKTPFVVPVGKDTIFPGGKGITFLDITDGTSNTALIFEATDDHMVVWTKPDDLPFDAKQTERGLIDKARPTFAVAFADGSVQMLPTTIPAAALSAIITRNGGEVIPNFHGGNPNVDPKPQKR